MWRSHQEAAQEGKLAQQHEAKERNSAFQDGVGIGQEIDRRLERMSLQKPLLPSIATELIYLLQRFQQLCRLSFCLLDISHKTKYLLKAFPEHLVPNL